MDEKDCGQAITDLYTASFALLAPRSRLSVADLGAMPGHDAKDCGGGACPRARQVPSTDFPGRLPSSDNLNLKDVPDRFSVQGQLSAEQLIEK
jgi:hypothetical protein